MCEKFLSIFGASFNVSLRYLWLLSPSPSLPSSLSLLFVSVCFSLFLSFISFSLFLSWSLFLVSSPFSLKLTPLLPLSVTPLSLSLSLSFLSVSLSLSLCFSLSLFSLFLSLSHFLFSPPSRRFCVCDCSNITYVERTERTWAARWCICRRRPHRRTIAALPQHLCLLLDDRRSMSSSRRRVGKSLNSCRSSFGLDFCVMAPYTLIRFIICRNHNGIMSPKTSTCVYYY